MGNVSITKKPSKSVSNLGAPSRESGNYKFNAGWKVPDALVSGKKNDRATGLKIQWAVEISNAKDPHKAFETGNEKKEASVLNLNSFSATAGGKTVSYTRNSFHPITAGHYVKSVSVSVTPTNSKGDGPVATASRSLYNPLTPSISAIDFNSENTRLCNATVSKNAGTLYQDQYDTVYTLSVSKASIGAIIQQTSTFGGDSQSISFDASPYLPISVSDYIYVYISAYARGLRGDSGLAEMGYFISYPTKAVIDTERTRVSSQDSAGQLTVLLWIPYDGAHPVDVVTLELLKNVTYATAGEIPNSAAWEDSGAYDNGSCTSFTISAAGLKPDKGKHVWIRVKTARANAEDWLCQYSEPMELKELYEEVPTAADDRIVIVSATPSPDGKSARVQLAWDDGSTPSTGTELTWSESEDTWKSTESPDTHEFTWSDGVSVTHGGIVYPNSAVITIKDLEEATKYFIRARRYLDDGDNGRSYSQYTNSATVLPHKTPSSVVAVCDRYVAIGSPLKVRWTLSSSTIQTAWKVRTTDGRTIAEGEGSKGYTQIDAKRLNDVATNGVVELIVEASSGSAYTASAPRTVSIVNRPTLSLTVPQTMTSQAGFSFTATSNRRCELIVIVTSQGASGQQPQGFARQTQGDTIYSNRYDKLTWTASGNSFTTTVAFPTPLDFWDKGKYTISVTAIDPETGLKHSEKPLEREFAVAWSHQAVSPADNVELTVVDEIGTDGEHIQAVRFNLTKPTGASNSDTYEIYRMDVEHPALICDMLPMVYPTQGSSDILEDRYAPFGGGYQPVLKNIPNYAQKNPSEEVWYELENGAYVESEDESVDASKTYYLSHSLYYRVALRTVDGDVEFADIEYVAPNKTMRFDWEDGTLELPYGLSMGDSFSKDFEIRHHMDGDVDGYWNPNVERKSSLSSSVIKLIQPDDIRKARQLARYAGAVFVRLPDGSAYEANVEVTDLSKKNDAVSYIAIDATEIAPTEEFSIPNPYKLQTTV